MKNVLEEIEQIMEPLNNMIQSNSYNDINQLIDLKIKTKNDLSEMQERINDELDSLRYEKVDRLLTIGERNQLGENLDENFNTNDIDEQISILDNALKLIEDSFKLTEYTDEERQSFENVQEKSNVQESTEQELIEDPQNVFNIPEILDQVAIEEPTKLEEPKITADESKIIDESIQAPVSTQQENNISESMEQPMQEEIKPVLETPEKIEDNILLETEPVIPEFNDELDKTAFISESVTEHLKNNQLTLEKPKIIETPESVKPLKDKTEEEKLIFIENLFKKSEKSNHELSESQGDNSKENDLISTEDFLKQSDKFKTELSESQGDNSKENDLISTEDFLKQSDEFKTELNVSPENNFEEKISDNTDLLGENNDPTEDLNDERRLFLNTIPEDFKYIKNEDDILSTQVTEKGIIANNMSQLCEHIFIDITEEMKKMNKLRLDGKSGSDSARYLSTKAEDDSKYYFRGESDVLTELPYGEYFNVAEFLVALEKYYEKDKGAIHFVKENNETYSMSEPKLKKIQKIFKTYSMIELARSKKITESDIMLVYGKKDLSKGFSQFPDKIKMDAKAGYYMNEQELIATLERVLKSKGKQLEWLKDATQNLKEELTNSEIKETLDENEETIKYK